MTDLISRAAALLPCPFCGGEGELQRKWPFRWTSRVICRCCGASTKWLGQVMDCPTPPSIRISAAWNTRALPAVAASQTPDPAVKADSQQPVRVKPLEWLDCATYGGRCYDAVGYSKVYRIVPNDGGDFYLTDPDCEWFHTSLEAAKAEAQADYEQRVLAAIEPQPDTRDAVIAQLVDALEREPTLIWIIENTTQVRIRDLALDMLEQQRAAIAAAKAIT